VSSWLDRSLPPVVEIHRRLKLIIPAQEDARGWARREMAAKTVFVMLYASAIEGTDRWIRPATVTDMTDRQAARQEERERLAWLKRVQGPRRPRGLRGRWYRENTREPIRDETIKTLLALGAVIERRGVPTTSPRPRYALAESFADLLDSSLGGRALESAIDTWQRRNLSKSSLARVTLARKGAGPRSGRTLVQLPNGETRSLAAGPSGILTQSVVEEFAPRFLADPAVVLISESAKKLTYRDQSLARSIGFTIRVAETLPDLVLVDLASDPPLLVFVECVVSDGPVDEHRRSLLEGLATEAGFRSGDCAYVTAFRDRMDSPFRAMVASLAWGSFVWFETEPDNVLYLHRGTRKESARLAELLRAERG
jgi:BsuBI/PstI restriction endonuclease domain/BsuBI/PstI restriction endonuclease HTH domain